MLEAWEITVAFAIVVFYFDLIKGDTLLASKPKTWSATKEAIGINHFFGFNDFTAGNKFSMCNFLDFTLFPLEMTAYKTETGFLLNNLKSFVCLINILELELEVKCLLNFQRTHFTWLLVDFSIHHKFVDF